MDMSELEKFGTKVTNNNKEPSEFMLLIGQEALNTETDEIEFVSLPCPLGIDTMKKSDVKGEGAFQENKRMGNDMLDALLSYAKENLKEGESKDIQLTVRLYRRKATQETKHKKTTFSFVAK